MPDTFTINDNVVTPVIIERHADNVIEVQIGEGYHPRAILNADKARKIAKTLNEYADQIST